MLLLLFVSTSQEITPNIGGGGGWGGVNRFAKSAHCSAIDKSAYEFLLHCKNKQTF